MFAVVEIDKTFSYEGTFTPYEPYIYSSIIMVGAGLQAESIATYWTIKRFFTNRGLTSDSI